MVSKFPVILLGKRSYSNLDNTIVESRRAGYFRTYRRGSEEQSLDATSGNDIAPHWDAEGKSSGKVARNEDGGNFSALREGDIPMIGIKCGGLAQEQRFVHCRRPMAMAYSLRGETLARDERQKGRHQRSASTFS